MRNKNILIVVLLAVGFCGLALVEGYIKPRQKSQEEQYMKAQQDPLTHDFSRLLKFKSPYMGDASNLGNLNRNLPLADVRRTLELSPDDLTAEIFYQVRPADIEKGLFHRALVYNATANFVLIDNLELLIFDFDQSSYAIYREAVEDWYGLELSSLQVEARWTEKVQEPLTEKGYVDSFISRNFIIKGTT